MCRLRLHFVVSVGCRGRCSVLESVPLWDQVEVVGGESEHDAIEVVDGGVVERLLVVRQLMPNRWERNRNQVKDWHIW